MRNITKEAFFALITRWIRAVKLFTCRADQPTPAPAAEAMPYRDNVAVGPPPIPAASSPPEEAKLVCELKGEERLDADVIRKLKAKTRRRAKRHFAGKEVRHRVTKKEAGSIEFAFFRRSGKPLSIKWRKPEASQEHNAT